MFRPPRLALASIALNAISLVVYSLAVSGAAFQKFTLATEFLSLMRLVNLTLSVVALTRSFKQGGGQGARKTAWISLAVAIGMIIVIGILLLNIWVTNIRTL